HSVGSSIERLHDDPGLVPWHADDGYGVCGRDRLKHRHGDLIVNYAVLHVYTQPVEACMCHQLRREARGHRKPSPEGWLAFRPHPLHAVFPHIAPDYTTGNASVRPSLERAKAVGRPVHKPGARKEVLSPKPPQRAACG